MPRSESLFICLTLRILDVSNNEIKKLEGLDWWVQRMKCGLGRTNVNEGEVLRVLSCVWHSACVNAYAGLDAYVTLTNSCPALETLLAASNLLEGASSIRHLTGCRALAEVWIPPYRLRSFCHWLDMVA